MSRFPCHLNTKFNLAKFAINYNYHFLLLITKIKLLFRFNKQMYARLGEKVFAYRKYRIFLNIGTTQERVANSTINLTIKVQIDNFYLSTVESLQYF